MKEIKDFKFINGDVEIETIITPELNTVWLNQKQIACLFNKSVSTINAHIKKIIKNNTPVIRSVIRYFSTTASDGKRYKQLYYNLHFIELIGARIKSDITSLFIAWCKDILAKINEKNDAESNLIRFDNGKVSLDIRVNPTEQTVWLTQNEISLLFETTRPNISMHIKNILDDKELDESSVSKDFLYTASDGKTYSVSLFNLDMVLAIGYRTKTNRAIEFRRWVSSILKEYLIKGYAINESRSLVTYENYIKLIDKIDELKNKMAKIELRQKHLFVGNRFIFNGHEFDGIVLINQIVETAHKNIILIDPYADALALDLFRNKKENVYFKVITSSKNKITKAVKKAFNKECHNLDIKIDDSFHDRFLIIDNEIFYQIGSSLNHLGKKTSRISIIEDETEINELKQKITNQKSD